MIFSILILVCMIPTLFKIKEAYKDQLGQIIFMIAGLQTSFSLFSFFVGKYISLLYLAISLIMVIVYSLVRRKELRFKLLLTKYFIFLMFSALLSGVIYLVYFA